MSNREQHPSSISDAAPSTTSFCYARSSSLANEDGSEYDVVSAISKNLYKDHSRVTTQEVEAEMRARRMASRKEPTFPMKLHRLLSDPDAEDVITWLPHGRAWKILSQEKFEATMLPRHFDHGNLASFMRQVNGWDFKRIVKGVDENGYYHELFLRGMPHLCLKMTRTKKSKNGGGTFCSPKLLSITPDFYRVSRDHPLPDEADNTGSQIHEGGHTSETDKVASAPSPPPSCSSSRLATQGTSEGMLPNQPADGNGLHVRYSNLATEALGLNQPADGNGLQDRYSNLASEALQRYITQDFVGAQMPMSNLQGFQQRLQARRELVNNLRNIASQRAQASAQTTAVQNANEGINPNIADILNIAGLGSQSINHAPPTIYSASALSNNPINDPGLLLELALANQEKER